VKSDGKGAKETRRVHYFSLESMRQEGGGPQEKGSEQRRVGKKSPTSIKELRNIDGRGSINCARENVDNSSPDGGRNSLSKEVPKKYQEYREMERGTEECKGEEDSFEGALWGKG